MAKAFARGQVAGDQTAKERRGGLTNKRRMKAAKREGFSRKMSTKQRRRQKKRKRKRRKRRQRGSILPNG